MSNYSRRRFLKGVAGATVAASLARASWGQTTRAGRKPNVLFIMSDDMRVELGCYASMFGAQTPNLDALAKAGVRFDRNYCQFPLCNPSRASLMTGRPATKTGVLGNRADFRKLHPDWISLPQLFRENGYTSIRVGKIFHGGIDDPKAWTEGYGAAEGDGGAGGRKLVIERPAATTAPDGVLAPLPADTSQAAHSDQIIVLDGNGEGHPDYHTADRAIEYLRKYRGSAGSALLSGLRFRKTAQPALRPGEIS